MFTRTSRTEITRNEYYQLVGLLSLSKQYNQKLRDILTAILDITLERDSDGNLDTCGHCGDVLYCDESVDDLLRKLNITVVDE